MNREHADAIVRTLEEGWHHQGPYRGGRCLGMAVSDTLCSEQLAGQAMADIRQQIRLLFPERISTSVPSGMLMFNCCDSAVIPAFSSHGQTVLEDLRLVIRSAVS